MPNEDNRPRRSLRPSFQKLTTEADGMRYAAACAQVDGSLLTGIPVDAEDRQTYEEYCRILLAATFAKDDWSAMLSRRREIFGEALARNPSLTAPLMPLSYLFALAHPLSALMVASSLKSKCPEPMSVYESLYSRLENGVCRAYGIPQKVVGMAVACR